MWNNITANDSMHQLDSMKEPEFDPIRQNEDFVAIENKLKKYAEHR